MRAASSARPRGLPSPPEKRKRGASSAPSLNWTRELIISLGFCCEIAAIRHPCQWVKNIPPVGFKETGLGTDDLKSGDGQSCVCARDATMSPRNWLQRGRLASYSTRTILL